MTWVPYTVDHDASDEHLVSAPGISRCLQDRDVSIGENARDGFRKLKIPLKHHACFANAAVRRHAVRRQAFFCDKKHRAGRFDLPDAAPTAADAAVFTSPKL